jgi:hypothetical protein
VTERQASGGEDRRWHARPDSLPAAVAEPAARTTPGEPAREISQGAAARRRGAATLHWRPAHSSPAAARRRSLSSAPVRRRPVSRGSDGGGGVSGGSRGGREERGGQGERRSVTGGRRGLHPPILPRAQPPRCGPRRAGACRPLRGARPACLPAAPANAAAAAAPLRRTRGSGRAGRWSRRGSRGRRRS